MGTTRRRLERVNSQERSMSRNRANRVPGISAGNQRRVTASDCGSEGCGFNPRRSPLDSGNHSEDSDWTAYLLPSERRSLRVAAKSFLDGLVTREEVKATISTAKLLAAFRRRAELVPALRVAS